MAKASASTGVGVGGEDELQLVANGCRAVGLRNCRCDLVESELNSKAKRGGTPKVGYLRTWTRNSRRRKNDRRYLISQQPSLSRAWLCETGTSAVQKSVNCGRRHHVDDHRQELRLLSSLLSSLISSLLSPVSVGSFICQGRDMLSPRTHKRANSKRAGDGAEGICDYGKRRRREPLAAGPWLAFSSS